MFYFPFIKDNQCYENVNQPINDGNSDHMYHILSGQKH